MTGCEVTFEPYGRKVKVKSGESLLKAAIEAGVYLKASCGGSGTCGGCKVQVISGQFQTVKTAALSREDNQKNLVLACQSTIENDLEVFVPEGSHSKFLRMPDRELSGKNLSSLVEPLEVGNIISGLETEPVVSLLELEIPPPSKSDNSSDLHRLRREIEEKFGIRSIDVEFSVIKKMGGLLRKANWNVAAIVIHGTRYPRVAGLRPMGTEAKTLAVSYDVGTTSVCAELLDLSCGEVIASTSEYNPQIRFGDDVISRIVFSQKTGGLETLQKAVVESMNAMLASLLRNVGASEEDVFLVTVAGNTTMTHLLLGVDPKSIREGPYVPTARFFPNIRPAEIGLNLPGNVMISVYPSVSSYVGGDVVAGLVSTGIFDDDRLTLFMDIGTNGEVVLGNKDWMISASCSAGPAFEGGGIKNGVRAVEGAIEAVKIDRSTLEPYLKTISDLPPVGICGSGLIDLVSEMFEVGVISQDGKFDPGVKSKRIKKTDGGCEYVLARAEESGIEKEITITDVDVDNLIRAKAAIYAGVSVLVKSLGFTFGEIDRVLIAGGFGQFINVEKAQKIGLLPDLPSERFNFVGNASLQGARLLALSRRASAFADSIARMVTNIELSDNPSFMDEYIGALFLPHTDASQISNASFTGEAATR